MIVFDEYDNVDSMYLDVCNKLLNSPIVDATGMRELLNCSFTVHDVTNPIIFIRNISIPYMFGELLWYFNGSNSLEFISKYASLWSRISDDGHTSNSAYGYILKSKHGFNQIDTAIDLLLHDRYNRKATINLNVPNFNVTQTKDEPCTIALQLYIRDNKLHCTGMMRSNDVWFGLPYDIIYFTEIQRYAARQLDVDLGIYTHFAVNLHMYQHNFETISLLSKDSSNHIDFDHDKFFSYNDVVFNKIRKFIYDHKDDPDVCSKTREYTIELAKQYFDLEVEHES